MGEKLGRYEILKHLANGDVAELFLARATGLEGFERHVVIKKLREELASDRSVVDAFVTEARLAATLHHQHIVQVHDIGEQDGAHFFAMEYVHGEEVRRLLATAFERNEKIPLDHVIAITMATATALHHAHEQKGSDEKSLEIVHRDVSPSNILIGYDGNIKVVDFGIARATLRTAQTQTGMLRGKAPYMSPEQASGKKIDRRSDVFSLGIVLYELVTCRRLFKASNEYLTMSAVVACTVPPPSKFRPDLPKPLEQVVLRALARDPGARFQTAQQLLEALDKVANELGLRVSNHALAAYMKHMFGERGEPWTPSGKVSPTVDVDFDGKGTGLAPPPAEALKPKPAVRPATTKGSPLETARSQVLAAPVAPVPAAASAPVQIPNGPIVAAPTAAAAKPAARAAVPPPKREKPKTIQIPTGHHTDPGAAVVVTSADAKPNPFSMPAKKPTPAPVAAAVATTLPGVGREPAPLAPASAAAVVSHAAPVPGPVTPTPNPFAVPRPIGSANPTPKPFAAVKPARVKPQAAVVVTTASSVALPLSKIASDEERVTGVDDGRATGDGAAASKSLPIPQEMPIIGASHGSEEATAVDPLRPMIGAADESKPLFVAPVEAADANNLVPANERLHATQIVAPLPPPITGSMRVLATDANATFDDAMQPARSKKWKAYAIGAGAALALILLVAIGFSGGGANEPASAQPVARARPVAPPPPVEEPRVERTWRNSPKAEPPAAEPASADPATATPALKEPGFGSGSDPAAENMAAAPAVAVTETKDEPEPAAKVVTEPAPKVETAPAKPAAAKVVTPPAAKIATKPAAKPEAAKPIAKIATTPTPVAKPAIAKPTAKPAATAKVTTQPAAKPTAKVATKPAVKPPTKIATKPAPVEPAKVQAKPAPTQGNWDQNSLFPKKK
ncbi:MAG: protein kinase [Deltaproteobacteria bacterium]|nr:protein kinase [Deltaproteobacteria bacterium]